MQNGKINLLSLTAKKVYKVLLIGPSSPHVANHLNRITRPEFEVELISNGGEYFPETIAWSRADFSMKSIRNFKRTPKIIRQKIMKFNPDVIHVHQANSVALYTVLGAKGTGVPIVLTAWGSDILISPKRSKLLRMMVKYVLKRVKVVTSDSCFMAEEMRKLVPGHNLDIEICNFGVPEFPLSDQKEKIIYSNRNHNPLYRIDEVIRAFHRFIENTDEPWKLVVAGKGSETEKLKQLSKDLNVEDSIEFVGFVNQEQNIDLYNRSTFFISLPESDATAMSLLEAMYYGGIPILSDLPANCEWVDDNSNGVIAKSLEENMISRALSLQTKEVRDRNHQLIKENGTIDVSRNKFKEVLIRAIEK